jgi:hypothetical protein
MAEIPRKDRAALKSDIALSRDRMGRELNGLRYELDVPRKLKDSFRNSPAVWVGAVAILGILVASSVLRPRKVYVRPKFSWKGGGKKDTTQGLMEAGALVGALRLVAPLLRPILIKFVTTKVRDYARNRKTAAR